jgi:nucleoid-associated protein YgaU
MNRSLRIGLLPVVLALAGVLRADDNAPSPSDVASIKADNKQLTDELAASWKEADKLKADLAAAQSAATKASLELGATKLELETAKAQPAEAAGSVTDLQDKLATSLRSFAVLQDENAALRASVDKLTGDNASLSQQLESAKASNSSLSVQAAATSQIDPLRTELRQSQDEASHLATENAELRTRLSLEAPGPNSGKPVPTRPGTAAALADSAPVAAPAPAAPAPKTYVVAEGDTLTKISRKFYGNSGHWEEILKANHLKDEKSLVVGSTLTIP